MHSVVKRIPTNQIQPIPSDLLAYIQKILTKQNLQHFSPTNLPPIAATAPPVEVSNGYQSPPSLPSVFPLPQPCSKVFLLRSFHSLVVSLPTRWAWYVDDPIEIPRTR